MYKLVEICEKDGGNFIGYAIKRDGLMKFESLHIYYLKELDEATKIVAEVNEAVAIREFWPTPEDPEISNHPIDSELQDLRAWARIRGSRQPRLLLQQSWSPHQAL